MPVPVVTHSPAETRRIAWSLVMAALAEEDGGLSAGEAGILGSQIDNPADFSQLAVELIHLAARLWEERHACLADARLNARCVALQLAGAQ
jgi:hypothetical protein